LKGKRQFYNRTRINRQIRARELRVIGEKGVNLGVVTFAEAFAKAQELGLDLIEISPNAKPPVAKIADFGKFQYDEKKKKKQSKGKVSETKTLQVKIATGEHDLMLKAKQASKFLKQGHRVKIDLFLAGRAKYLDKNFLKERLDRILHFITESYKVADGPKKSPKGLTIVLEKTTKKHDENE